MNHLVAAFTWYPMDTWIVIVGALCAMSCALLGCYLVLRKMSMMGDAISHAVLPGLALAFLLSGSRDNFVMLLGAGVVGVLTALFTQWIHTIGKVEQGAAMGVVFTVLFAIGLILVRKAADHVDLDPECVLYGAIELVPLDTLRVLGLDVPRAALLLGGVFVLNLLFVVLLYKELKLSSFDPALATTLGINARLMHYLLMTLVALTTVAAFESVGSILVIAMLIVPAAAAHLLTERLSRMVLVSIALAAFSAGLGHVAAIVTPGWFGFSGVSTNTAGMMAVVTGVLFGLALLFAPRHGLLSRAVHRARLALRILREDVLGLLYRLREPATVRRGPADAPFLARVLGAPPVSLHLALTQLRRAGQVERVGREYRLTPAGAAAARQVVRSHRLWEAYFERYTPLPADHVHPVAERLEHVTGPRLQSQLAATLEHPEHDPHGAPIPESENDPQQ